VYDDKVPGLAVCVTANGAKTFYRTGRVKGRYVRLKLGRFPEITVAKARELANKAAGQVADGKDPQAERRLASGELTLGELFDRFLNERSKPRKKTWREDEAQYKRYLMSRWANRKLSSIATADVMSLHGRIGKHNGHYAANRLLALLSSLFTFAKRVGEYQGDNPAKGIERFPEKSRERFLRPDEMAAFWAAVEAESNTSIRDFIKLCLLTGARRSNVMAMRWDDVHLTRGEWTIPDTKSGEPVTVVLSPPAVEILKVRLAGREDGNDWVFPSHGKSGHLVEPKATWNNIRAAAGLSDVRLHDLRRTKGSWMAAAGVSLPIIGKALGHKSLQSTAIYARLNLDPVRAAVHAAADALVTAAGNGEGRQ
jgi:integrase